jgi:D-alanyl-D-alanine carboxypeptidase
VRPISRPDRRVRQEHPFRIGSITKPAIATVVLQLAEEGALAVSDPIEAWFPGFPNGATITVDDLLRMRSGIVDSWTGSQLEAYYADPTAPLTAEDMIARAAQAGERFKTPDSETVYTNLNYILLDKIIAAVTGEPTPAVLEARIFAPLGMTASELPTGTDLPGPLRGYGWNAQTGEYEDKTELNPEPVGGAGAMISSLEDLHAFVRALCTGALLSPEGQATRLDGAPLKGAPDFLRYGQGIGSLGEFCGHNGTIMGFSTEAWYLPSQDAAVVINVNRLDVDDNSMSSPLFFKLTKLLFPDEVEW